MPCRRFRKPNYPRYHKKTPRRVRRFLPPVLAIKPSPTGGDASSWTLRSFCPPAPMRATRIRPAGRSWRFWPWGAWCFVLAAWPVAACGISSRLAGKSPRFSKIVRDSLFSSGPFGLPAVPLWRHCRQLPSSPRFRCWNEKRHFHFYETARPAYETQDRKNSANVAPS